MRRSIPSLLCLASLACERLPTEVIPRDPLAHTGDVVETPWETVGLCIEASEGPPTPPGPGAPRGERFVEIVNRQDELGNVRWGAGYSAGLALELIEDGPGGAETRLRGDITAHAIVFETRNDVVSAVLEGYSRQDGDARLSAALVFVGRYVYPLFVYEGSFSHARDLSHRVLEVKVPYAVGGWPVELTIGIWGVLGYSVSGQLFPTGFGVGAEPYGVAIARANVGTGHADIAHAAVSGSVELLDVALPLRAAFDVSREPEGGLSFGWSAVAELDARWLDGRLDLGVTVPKRRFAETLADWEGYGSHTVLAQGSGSVRVTTRASECGPAALHGAPSGPVLAEVGAGPDADTPAEWVDAIARLPHGREHAHARVRWLGALTDALLEDPELARELATAAVDAPDVVAALGAAGCPSCLHALAELAEDRGAPEEIRVRAIATAGLVLAPSPTLVEAVLRVLAGSDGAVEETASYALGNLAATLGEHDPRAAARLTGELLTRSEAETSPARRAVLVRALANTRAAEGLERAAHIAADGSEDPAVREAAEQALRMVVGAAMDARDRGTTLGGGGG
jgi:hypothetical protein